MEDSGDSDDSISYHTAPSDFDGTADLGKRTQGESSNNSCTYIRNFRYT